MLGTAVEANETTKIVPNMSGNGTNEIAYHAPTGKQWVVNTTQEAYIDLETDNTLASEAYYEISFVGNGIEIFANKNKNHGKVNYSVDGENVIVADLYSASRTNPQSVYKVENLSEGIHTLKAVLENTQSGSTFVKEWVYFCKTNSICKYYA